MNQTDWTKMKDLFAEVVTLPPAERASFLDRRCAGDPGLRAKIEELVLAHESSDVSRAGMSFESAPTLPSASAASASEEPGGFVGAYRLLQRIGEGGFGTVFMAEQQAPVRRRVALKIVKLGMDTKSVVARFEAERQALAMMDHPNIARVLDAGATPTGRPYFVMELVKGDPITAYCDNNQLPISERLGLFTQVCQAVQHAHQKGIIHRDIKPSNVLVSTQDGRPHAKVIDFGIAKATDYRLTEKTYFTEHRALIGTPEYMSPEQAEGLLDIDTRTDVYSLGVLLYELLTGSTPFDPKKLRSAAYGEIQRIIREIDPPKPSTRVSQSGEMLPNLAARRRVEPRKLGTLVRGELDWIVMRALEKDRSRRYDTAGNLAADVDRYLSGSPVEAAPPSVAYRARTFVRRNRAVVLGGALVVLALSAGVVGTTVGLVRANAAREKESQQREAAEQHARESREQSERASASERAAEAQRNRAQRLSRVLSETLQGVGPSVARGRDTTVLREMMDRVVVRLDRGEFLDDPISEVELRLTIGEVLLRISEFDRAAALLDPAVARARAIGADAGDRLVQCLVLLSRAEFERDHADTAERWAREAIAECERLGDPAREWLARSHNALGMALGSHGEDPAALEAHQRAAEIAKSARPDGSLIISESLMLVATKLSHLGRAREAEPILREAIAAQSAAIGVDDAERLALEADLAVNLADQRQFVEAETILRRVIAEGERLYPDGHRRMASVYSTLASVLMHTGRLPEAEVAARRSVALVDDRGRSGSRNDRAVILSELGLILSEQSKWAEARDVLEQSVTAYRAIHPGDHRDTATALNNLASAYSGLGDQEGAIRAYRDVLGMRRRMFPGDHPAVANSINNLAATFLQTKDYDQSASLYQESLAMIRRVAPKGHVVAIAGECGLAVIDAARRAREDCLAHFASALTIADALFPGDHPAKARVLLRRAQALGSLGAPDEAVKDADAAVGMMSRLVPAGHPLLVEFTTARDALVASTPRTDGRP